VSARDQPTLIEVRLVDLSLADFSRSSAHHDELFREFALVLANDPSPGHEVPARLLALIEELNQRFGGFTAASQAELEAALDRGEEAVDLVFRVPPEARAACIRLTELLSAADDYCRAGALLTLAPPADAVVFRNWYLGEFVAQIDGSDPSPWPEFRARAAPTA
jgi:hypothetical protein